jgi:hypothetical protein
MSVGLLIAVLEVAAPSLATGIGGAILARLQNPLAGGIVKLGKKLASGDHLDEEEKDFIREYNKNHGMDSPGYIHSMFH